MKATLLISLALFSNVAFANDFYSRYLIETSGCQDQSRQMQQISTFFHCVVGALETIKGDPYFVDYRTDADILIERNAKRASAWEEYENFKISEKELNVILGKIDRNE